MTMLFSHREREVFEDATISGMKVGQLCGHSCLRICNRGSGKETEGSLRAVHLNKDEIELLEVDFIELVPPRRVVPRLFDDSGNDEIPNT
jgi:hypothetical protein